MDNDNAQGHRTYVDAQSAGLKLGRDAKSIVDSALACYEGHTLSLFATLDELRRALEKYRNARGMFGEAFDRKRFDSCDRAIKFVEGKIAALGSAQ